MKDGSVANNAVKNRVGKADRFATMLSVMDQVLRTPKFLEDKAYKKVQ